MMQQSCPTTRSSMWSRIPCAFTMMTVLGGGALLLAPQELASAAATVPQEGGQAQPPKPFISFSSAGVETYLRSPKDAWVLDAVKRMQTNGIQLPPEAQSKFDEDPNAALAVAILRDLLTGRLVGSMALSPPEGGGPPMPEGQVSFLGTSKRPGGALEPLIVEALKRNGVWQGFRPDNGRPGLSTFKAGEGPQAWFGSLDIGGSSATVLSVGRPPSNDAPDFARFGVAKGTEPQFSFELDLAPLQPYLGMASAMLPPGPDGRSALEQSGLISKTPMSLRVVGTNDGVDGRIIARLVNGAKALPFNEASRAMTIQPADLQWIPVDARTAMIGKADYRSVLNSLVDQANAQAAIFGEGEDDFDDGMGGDDDMGGDNGMNDGDGANAGANEGVVDRWFQDELGVDLRRGLIDALGDVVVMQSSASMGGGLFGTVGIITLRDSKAMAGTLDKLSKALAGNEELRKGGVGLRARTHPGCDALYSLSIAGIPLPLQITIGIGNGALVAGLSTQAVTRAIAQAKAKSSIVDHAGFKAINGPALIKEAHSIGWSDAPATLQNGYGGLLALAAALDNTTLPQSGAATPVTTVVPPLEQVLAGAKASLLVGRIEGDDLLWNYQYDGSFTVQTASAMSQASSSAFATAALVAGLVMPAYTKAQAAAEQAAARARAGDDDDDHDADDDDDAPGMKDGGGNDGG